MIGGPPGSGFIGPEGMNVNMGMGMNMGIGMGMGVSMMGMGLGGMNMGMGLGGMGMNMSMMHGVGNNMGVGMGVDELWPQEQPDREFKAKYKIHLGTFVFPNTPFPYFFDVGEWIGVNGKEKEKAKEKGRIGNSKEEEKENNIEESKEKDVVEKEEGVEEKEEKENGEKEKEKESVEDGEKTTTTADEVKDKDVIVIEEDDENNNNNVATTKVQEEEEDDEDMLDVETRATIIIPSGYIPREKPSQPRIWGGGVIGRLVDNDQPTHHQKRSSTNNNHLVGNGNVDVEEGENGNDEENKSKSKSQSKKSSSQAKSKSQPSTSTSTTSIPNRPKKRRIYTDDSDLFLCALHSGWLTWSSGSKAYDQGKDLKVEVRIIRCAGAGAGSVFAVGAGAFAGKFAPAGNGVVTTTGVFKTRTSGVESNTGSASRNQKRKRQRRSKNGDGEVDGDRDINGTGEVEDDDNDKLSSMTFRKEEIVGRFIGGWGEKCFVKDLLNRSGVGVSNNSGGSGDFDEEMGMESDEDDDGRGLVSAGWGSGHDGSAIEIIGVEFLDVRFLFLSLPPFFAFWSFFFLTSIVFTFIERNSQISTWTW